MIVAGFLAGALVPAFASMLVAGILADALFPAVLLA